jgi:stringent starvation protein B
MTDSDTRRDEKKERLERALDLGMVQVHVDARRPGAAVPEHLASLHHLVLNLSYRFDPQDLTVTDWGVRETLSFGGTRFTVGLPWSCIYAIGSHVTFELWMYPEDVPQELLASLPASASGEQAVAPPSEGPRVVLREVSAPEPTEEPRAAEPQASSEPRRGHLRLVK